jgi:hypothetical protein
MARITNEVLLEKINNIGTDIAEVKQHMRKMNGQVAKNTEHRIQQTTINKIVYLLITTSSVGLVGVVNKIFF